MRLDAPESQKGAFVRSRFLRRPAFRLPDPTSLASAQRPMPWRSILAPAATLWFATRLAYLTLTCYYPLVSGGYLPSTATVSLPALVRRWTEWDGAWYIQIARMGYTSSTISAFFPLYPGLIRLTAFLIGPHWAAAALLASNLSALLAFFGVAALAAQIAPPGEEAARARIAVTLFAAYPLAFFLVAAYSDGLFAGLAALALVLGMRRRWGWAALCGLLVVLCRPVGVAIILPLAWEAFQRYRERRVIAPANQALRDVAPALAAIFTPVVGLGAYCAFLWLRFGDPLNFIRVESSWARFSLTPVISVPVAILEVAHLPLFSTTQARALLDLMPLLVALALTFVGARRAPIALTLYLLALLYIITSAPINYVDLFVSAGRYMLAAVPLFALAGGWLRRSEWILQSLCWCGTLLQAILAVYFLGHGWIV